MRCDSLHLIGTTIDIQGVEAQVISAGPLCQKTDTYDLIVKIKVTKDLVDTIVEQKILDIK